VKRGGARLKLYAPPTRVTFTQTTVDCEIDRLWLRVEIRAAELGIDQTEVARRMGISRRQLRRVFGGVKITRERFQKLAKALEGVVPGQLPDLWWERPIPKAPNVSAEKMRRALRRKLQ
jgi:transcriptional regulator with XRE-family HTH domain